MKYNKNCRKQSFVNFREKKEDFSTISISGQKKIRFGVDFLGDLKNAKFEGVKWDLFVNGGLTNV